MHIFKAAFWAAACCVVQAQAQQPPTVIADGDVLTLEKAIAAAGGSAPSADAAKAVIDAAHAARAVAGLRPNPTFQAQVENVAGSGPYRALDSAETTVGLNVPIELGGKRSARIAVADAQLLRSQLDAAMTQADIRLQITQLYIEAVAAERRRATAQDQLRIAGDALSVARLRVQAGRASPMEEQRAQVAQINAQTSATRTGRLTDAARSNLARRIGRSSNETLDLGWLDRLPDTYGPVLPPDAAGTLALATAEADLTSADAAVRLAQSQRMPDLDVGPAVRRLSQTGDTALIFTVSMPIPLFNTGKAAVAQANAQRNRASAMRRMTALDIEQAITDALAQADNAATLAQTANGPALAAAQEAVRIARIGYREGKFGQIDLLDAERTLAETRLSAIDALAAYHLARAQLERLTAPAPQQGN